MSDARPTSTQTMVIRPAQLEDLAQISKLGAEIFSSSFGHSMPKSDLTSYLTSAYSSSSLLTDFNDPAVDIIVASPSHLPTRVIGFAQIRCGSTETCLAGFEGLIELQRLYIDTAHHGGGLGKALIAETERLARSGGFANLWLGVWEENSKAQGLYRHMGFEKIGTHNFTMGGCVQTDWIMLKSL